MKTLFDLRSHSTTDLRRLEMAVDTGIDQCGNVPALKECKESLLAYRNIINQAISFAADREWNEGVAQEVQKIVNSN